MATESFVRYPETVFLLNQWQVLDADVAMGELEARMGHVFIRISDYPDEPDGLYGCVSVLEGGHVFRVLDLWHGLPHGHELPGYPPLPSCVVEMEISPDWESRITAFAAKLGLEEFAVLPPDQSIFADDEWARWMRQVDAASDGETRFSLEVARMLFRMGRIEESHLLLSGVLATRPVGSGSHDLASTHLACVLLSRGDVSAAIEVFRQMAERGSDLGALALSSLERG